MVSGFGLKSITSTPFPYQLPYPLTPHPSAKLTVFDKRLIVCYNIAFKKLILEAIIALLKRLLGCHTLIVRLAHSWYVASLAILK